MTENTNYFGVKNEMKASFRMIELNKIKFLM